MQRNCCASCDNLPAAPSPPPTPSLVGAVRLDGAPYGFRTNGIYYPTDEAFSGATVYQRRDQYDRTWSLYRRRSGRWVLDYNEVENRWSGTVAFSRNKRAASLLEAEWNRGAMEVHSAASARTARFEDDATTSDGKSLAPPEEDDALSDCEEPAEDAPDGEVSGNEEHGPNSPDISEAKETDGTKDTTAKGISASAGAGVGATNAARTTETTVAISAGLAGGVLTIVVAAVTVFWIRKRRAKSPPLPVVTTMGIAVTTEDNSPA